MSWLRENWNDLALLIVFIVMVTGWVGAAHYRGVAQAEAEEGARRTVEIEEYRARILEDSLEMIEAEEALAAARDADIARVVQLEEARQAAQHARDLFDRTAQAQRDSTDGWVRAETYDAALAAERQETARADSASAIWEERAVRAELHAAEILQPRITELTAQVVRLEERDVVRLREIDARTPRPTFSFGNLTDNWELVALGVLIGAVGWELAR